MPRRRIPEIVGMRGSFQPSTCLSLTKRLSFAFTADGVFNRKSGEFNLLWMRWSFLIHQVPNHIRGGDLQILMCKVSE